MAMNSPNEIQRRHQPGEVRVAPKIHFNSAVHFLWAGFVYGAVAVYCDEMFGI